MNTTISNKIKELDSILKSGTLLTIREYKDISNGGGIHLFTGTIEGQNPGF